MQDAGTAVCRSAHIHCYHYGRCVFYCCLECREFGHRVRLYPDGIQFISYIKCTKGNDTRAESGIGLFGKFQVARPQVLRYQSTDTR